MIPSCFGHYLGSLKMNYHLNIVNIYTPLSPSPTSNVCIRTNGKPHA